MRLERVASALAIVLFLLAAIGPSAFAASPASATIVSPGEGATVPATSMVRIHYAGYTAGAQNVSGYLMLDGEPAGTFFAKTSPTSPANGTTFDATLRGAGFASGAHALSARVFTERDGPVDTPPIAIVLDTPPTISDLSVAYDHDARRLLVEATVTDDGGASLVWLASGLQRVNATGEGRVALSLYAPRGAGTYDAALGANDSHGQASVIRFTYDVVDREADLEVLEASYQLGGQLLVSGTVLDRDQPSWMQITTPLGNGYANVANGSWSSTFNVTPKLGTFNGTVTTWDAWGGSTQAPFTFTIHGASEILFERVVTTGIGAHADESSISIPGMLGGTIEICVEVCNATDAGPAPWAPFFDVICSHEENLPCRALTGRPVSGGALDLCQDTPPPNFPLRPILGSPVWSARKTVENATGAGPCTSVRDELEARANGTGAASGIAIVVSSPLRVHCASTGGDARCGFDAPRGTVLDLSWLQGAGRTASVRVSGIRV